jgi:hypothetical protein
LQLARDGADGAIPDLPVIDAHDGRDAHRRSGEEQFVAHIEFAAVDGPLHN